MYISHNEDCSLVRSLYLSSQYFSAVSRIAHRCMIRCVFRHGHWSLIDSVNQVCSIQSPRSAGLPTAEAADTPDGQTWPPPWSLCTQRVCGEVADKEDLAGNA